MLEVQISEKTKQLINFDTPSPQDTFLIDKTPTYHAVKKSTLVQKVTEKFKKQKY